MHILTKKFEKFSHNKFSSILKTVYLQIIMTRILHLLFYNKRANKNSRLRANGWRTFMGALLWQIPNGISLLKNISQISFCASRAFLVHSVYVSVCIEEYVMAAARDVFWPVVWISLWTATTLSYDNVRIPLH